METQLIRSIVLAPLGRVRAIRASNGIEKHQRKLSNSARKSILDVRIYVGKDPLHLFSQKPKSRCHDVLQTPQIEKRDDATSKYVTWMPMHYVEACYGDSSCRPLAVTHTLKVGDRKLKSKLKRVDLVNSEAAFGNIQLFM